MIEIVIIVLIFGLASARITYLFIDEDGPYEIFKKIRAYFEVYDIELPDGSVQKITQSNNLISQLLLCKWCFSIWVALVLLIGLLIPKFIYFVLIFAISMLSIIIFKFTE